MAQSVSCNFNNTIPFSKPLNLNPNCYGSVKFPTLGFAARPRIGGVRAMAAGETNEALDYLPGGGVKRREDPFRPLASRYRFPTATDVELLLDLLGEPWAFTRTRPSTSGPTTDGGYARGRKPRAMKETQDEYKMRFDMPGMTRNDVKVWVEENRLVIKAEKAPKKQEGQEKNGGVVAEEEDEWPAKSFGVYRARIPLPENVDFEKIKAEVKDGVLYITLPKSRPSPKVVDINVE